MEGASLHINGEAALHWASGTLDDIHTVDGPVRHEIRHVIEIVRMPWNIPIIGLRRNQGRQSIRLGHARACIVVLVREFFPEFTIRSIETALLRADGWGHWALGRHEDRMKVFPEYAQLYFACREQVAIFAAAVK